MSVCVKTNSNKYRVSSGPRVPPDPGRVQHRGGQPAARRQHSDQRLQLQQRSVPVWETLAVQRNAAIERQVSLILIEIKDKS